MKLPDELKNLSIEGFLIVLALALFGVFIISVKFDAYASSIASGITIVSIILIISDILLVIGSISQIRKLLSYRRPLRLDHRPESSRGPVITISREEVLRHWNKISKTLEGDDINAIRLAIIEADAVIDDLLKQIGLKGEHMADRLESLSRSNWKSVDSIWRAHRLRNEIAHSPSFEISPRTALRAKEDYETFLLELGILKRE